MLGSDRPWFWLAAGWRDMCRCSGISFAYGGLVVAASYLLAACLGWFGVGFLVLPAAAGFALMAPVLASGLIEVSRRLERGEPVRLGIALATFVRHGSGITAIGGMLLLVFMIWIRMASLLVMPLLTLGEPMAEAEPLSVGAIHTLISAMVAAGAVGLPLGFLVFALTAVSMPMLIDGRSRVSTAIATSLATVRLNLLTMSVWAALIAVLTAAGLATAFLGLAIAFPLLAHATWHAYRDLVVTESAGTRAEPAAGSGHTRA